MRQHLFYIALFRQKEIVGRVLLSTLAPALSHGVDDDRDDDNHHHELDQLVVVVVMIMMDPFLATNLSFLKRQPLNWEANLPHVFCEDEDDHTLQKVHGG